MRIETAVILKETGAFIGDCIQNMKRYIPI